MRRDNPPSQVIYAAMSCNFSFLEKFTVAGRSEKKGRNITIYVRVLILQAFKYCGEALYKDLPAIICELQLFQNV
jgi:hypothetical protein